MGQASRNRILRQQKEAEAARAKMAEEDEEEDPWPDLDDEPWAQLEAEPAEPQAARNPAPAMSRSRRADPAWRVRLARNRSRLRGLQTREADARREQAELVRQALDVGASVSAISRVLGFSRRTFYDRYGEMLHRARQ